MKLILITLIAVVVVATSACSKSEDDPFLIEMADWWGEYMRPLGGHDFTNETWSNRFKNSMPKLPSGSKYLRQHNDLVTSMNLLANAQTKVAEYVPIESRMLQQRYGDPVPPHCINVSAPDGWWYFSPRFIELCEQQSLADANWTRVRGVWEWEIFKIYDDDRYGVRD